MARILKIAIFIYFGVNILFKISTPCLATFVKYSSNPVLPNGPTGSWDEEIVNSSSAIFDGSQFKMWYSGYSTLTHGQIGLATSNDGIHWSKLTNPILSPNQNDGWEKDIGEPSVIFDGNNYQMWYLSANFSSNNGEYYRIKHAISNNGINWSVDNGYALVKNSQLAWESRGVSNPSVLDDNGVLKMWYAGNDINDNWRIGYAYYENGVWNKNANSVLDPDPNTEGYQVAQPSVIKRGNTFEMYYHSGHGNPRDIRLATSSDGINWSRSSNNPLLVLGVDPEFDHEKIGQPAVLLFNNLTLLYYSGYDGNYWQIGLATDGVFPIPSPSPTPSPTPEPSPIPSPSPTPPTTKVILIPGLGGSWNKEALTKCTLDNYQDNWSLIPFVGSSVYQPVMDRLNSEGYQILPFYYDWRKSVTQNGQALETFIQQNTQTGEKVHLVGHSMGGLVARAYLEHAQNQNKVDKLLTVGSPHQGVPQAYYAWSGGEIFGDTAWKMYGSLVVYTCKIYNLSLSSREIIQKFIPSTQNLLPTFPYLKDKKTSVLLPVEQMSAQNNWLPNTFFPPFFGAYTGTLSGIDHGTPHQIIITQPKAADLKNGNWLDGKPQQLVSANIGDGTVLTQSSEVSATDEQLQLDTNHGGLINSTAGLDLISQFLHGSQLKMSIDNFKINTQSSQQNTSDFESALILIADGANVWAFPPHAKPVKDTEGLIIITNPKTMNIPITILPQKWNMRLYVGQILKNGKTKWKHYDLSNLFPKFKTVKFNSAKPTEDILK